MRLLLKSNQSPYGLTDRRNVTRLAQEAFKEIEYKLPYWIGFLPVIDNSICRISAMFGFLLTNIFIRRITRIFNFFCTGYRDRTDSIQRWKRRTPPFMRILRFYFHFIFCDQMHPKKESNKQKTVSWSLKDSNLAPSVPLVCRISLEDLYGYRLQN